MEMEQQKQEQEQPWEEEQPERQQEEVGLVSRQSRRRDNNKPTIPAPVNAIIATEEEGTELNYDNGNVNGDDNDIAAAAGFSEANGHEEEANTSSQKKSSVYFDNNEDNGSAADEIDVESIIDHDHHHQKDSGVDLTEEIDQEFTEVEVERVIEKQTTHDLYCPHCRSCITRRVILRRRKRPVPKIPRKRKPDKFGKRPATDANDQVQDQDQDQGRGHDNLNISSNDGPTAHDAGPLHIFRCLSCFTIFIPSGNCLKPFWTSRDSKGNGETQDVQNISSSNKRKIPMDQGNRAADRSVAPDVDRNPLKIIPPEGDVENNSDNAVAKNNKGYDLKVIIETPSTDEPVSSQNVNTAGILAQTGTDAGNTGPEAGAAHRLDILKSIVYGGLLEAITSLGVVSSAAASDASTLNILVLGLANLMSGLFIIVNNLRELKNDREDRYQQVLGRRANFLLHATLVVLSFLIFGLMPPVIYGFSFRESDNRDLKISAVAGSSLACIILLAIGKAHVERPPRSYIITVLHYVAIGFTTSGLSYVAGDLIKQLLQQLHLFEPSLDVTSVPFVQANFMKPRWASF